MEYDDEIKIKDVIIMQNIRVRIEKEDLGELMSSIKQHGLLEPIGVWKQGSKYVLRFGHRRLEACRKLGWETIGAMVDDEPLSDAEFLVINTIENIQRKDITPIELGGICKKLKEEEGFTLSEIAAKISISQSRVRDAILLFERVPDEFKKDVRFIPPSKANNKGGKLSVKVAQHIVSRKFTDANKKKLFKLAKKEGLSGAEINIIGDFIRRGLGFKQAVEEVKKYTFYHINIPLNKKEIERIQKKHDFKSRQAVIHAILSGQIPGDKRLVIFKATEKCED